MGEAPQEGLRVAAPLEIVNADDIKTQLENLRSPNLAVEGLTQLEQPNPDEIALQRVNSKTQQTQLIVLGTLQIVNSAANWHAETLLTGEEPRQCERDHYGAATYLFLRVTL